MKPASIATPLQGSSSVPTLWPKYSANPGPARVAIALLRHPIKTIMTNIVLFSMAKFPNSLVPKSAMHRTRMEKAVPRLSPSQPQKKAPAIETTLQSTLTQLRKWSSLTMGRKMILKLMLRQISQRLIRNETEKIMINRASFIASFTSSLVGAGSSYSSDLVFSTGQSLGLADSFISSLSWPSTEGASFFRKSKLPNRVNSPVMRKPTNTVLGTFSVTPVPKKLMSPYFMLAF